MIVFLAAWHGFHVMLKNLYIFGSDSERSLYCDPVAGRIT